MGKFFDTKNLSFRQKRNILFRAKKLCKNWWVDELDCSKSFCRQKIDITFEEVMSYFKNDSHFTMIHRNFSPENHLEIGFRAVKENQVDIFLWIILDPELIPKFTKTLINI